MSAVGYIVQCDGGDYAVKIGRTRNVSSRIKSLQTSNPHRLRLIAIVRDGSAFEEKAKVDLAAYRLSGEWYRPCTELQALIDQAIAQKNLITQIDPKSPEVTSNLKALALDYLKGRDANQNDLGDLVFRLLHDGIENPAARASDLSKATRGHITEDVAMGYVSTSQLVSPLVIPNVQAFPSKGEAA